ncbi:MAG: 4a-hydroxytetrahydrobiopterin dehydratase [Bacteroidetes bacterium]|nr:4a-hydroxytetrahydrobiopterin dehydratase [Bacteroidota bacterium]
MNWEKEDNFLQKNFKFKNFGMAMDFINKIARIAEEMNHHPDILLHSYNQVLIKTMTHDVGEITDKDYTLSKKIDAL